jgi:hypothetical protein
MAYLIHFVCQWVTCRLGAGAIACEQIKNENDECEHEQGVYKATTNVGYQSHQPKCKQKRNNCVDHCRELKEGRTWLSPDNSQ